LRNFQIPPSLPLALIYTFILYPGSTLEGTIMAEMVAQNLSNHARYDPWFHFLAVPVLLVSCVISTVLAFRHPGFLSIWTIVFNVALVITAFKVRLYALKVQDRLICLEQRLRLQQRLPDSQRSQIASLSEGQLVALRFASDDEVPALVQQTVSARLPAPAIKKAIKNWRPDYFRV
jgi:hypothetical protein